MHFVTMVAARNALEGHFPSQQDAAEQRPLLFSPEVSLPRILINYSVATSRFPSLYDSITIFPHLPISWRAGSRA